MGFQRQPARRCRVQQRRRSRGRPRPPRHTLPTTPVPLRSPAGHHRPRPPPSPPPPLRPVLTEQGGRREQPPRAGRPSHGGSKGRGEAAPAGAGRGGGNGGGGGRRRRRRRTALGRLATAPAGHMASDVTRPAPAPSRDPEPRAPPGEGSRESRGAGLALPTAAPEAGRAPGRGRCGRGVGGRVGAHAGPCACAGGRSRLCGERACVSAGGGFSRAGGKRVGRRPVLRRGAWGHVRGGGWSLAARHRSPGHTHVPSTIRPG